jgi:hypothetical protein
MVNIQNLQKVGQELQAASAFIKDSRVGSCYKHTRKWTSAQLPKSGGL